MKRLTMLLLFTSLFGYAQIDYKGLIKNVEDITYKTDIKAHFKGIPFNEEYSEIEFNDERFLRFYGVIVNKVTFSDSWSGKVINIKPFNENADYEKIKAKLFELYGEPETSERTTRIRYEWETDNKQILLSINLQGEEEEEEETVQGVFKDFDSLTILLKQE